MCNAYQHPYGCTCGWGGEGHIGRSYGGGKGCGSRSTGYSSYNSEGSKRWHKKPMSELAMELGHSLLFPIYCRYCCCSENPGGGLAARRDKTPRPPCSAGGVRNAGRACDAVGRSPVDG